MMEVALATGAIKQAQLQSNCHHQHTTKKWVKEKEVDLYSAFIEVPYTQGAQVRITHSVTCKLHRTCLYLVSIHQMAHPRLRLRTSN